MRTKILILFLFVFGLCRCLWAATLSTNGLADDVNAKIAVANPGDIVDVPAGTFSWTQRVTVDRPGITLRGQSTVTNTHPTGSGEPAPTYSDVTIIQDALPSAGALIEISPPVSSATTRVTGLTIEKTATFSGGNGVIHMSGDNQNIRLDHCHLRPMANEDVLIQVSGSVCGVADHLVIYESGAQTWYMGNGNTKHGSTLSTNGNGSWADPTNWEKPISGS